MGSGELPSGRVTLLFTDVEGSTRLLHELGAESYAEKLAGHRRIVREVCTVRGGVEVDTQGDAFFLAFPRALDAIEAARLMTEALASGPIALRIGVHTGAPHLTEEGYVGDDVHLAARVAASAHGGQVVLTQATRALLDDTYSLLHLGEHRLKDIPDPIPIFQLGNRPFPPLKTISNTNLPRPASSFIGRERELSAVLERIGRGTRLLTLTGPGGSGKTRLALEAATSLVPEYTAGVFWVGLAALRDPALILDTVAQTLGAKDGLTEHIGDRQMLLLLDNLEQVSDGAPQLSALLAGCPNLGLLATSRELLRIAGEVEYPVPPLDLSEAVALFCERGGLEPTADIEELCRRLDALPLAVELAAARVRVLSPRQILDRLAQRLDLLKGGRDADPRQQTLRTTIEWSHDLLKPHERQLFARLSVFAGGCTLEAAEDVAGADVDTLQSLVEKSLVRQTEERFWMLETIREYAGERLDAAADAAELRRRHATWVAALVTALAAELRRLDPDAVAVMAVEHPNVRDAMTWSLESEHAGIAHKLIGDLCVYWIMVGRANEGVAFAERALAAENTPPAARLAGMAGSSELFRFTGDFRRGIALKEELLELLDDTDLETFEIGGAVSTPEGARIALLKDLAQTYPEIGALDLARARADEALRRAEELGDDTDIAHCAYAKGIVEFHDGNYAEARRVFAATLDTWRRHGWRGEISATHLMLGECLRREGRTEEALRELQTALETRAAAETSSLFEILQELAVVTKLRGDLDAAARLLGASEAFRREVGMARWDHADVERTTEELRRLLGTEAFDSLWKGGTALTHEQATELARLIV